MKSGFKFWNPERISDIAIEREIQKWISPPEDGFQLGNPNPDFMDFAFSVRLGNPKKDLQNYPHEQRSSFSSHA